MREQLKEQLKLASEGGCEGLGHTTDALYAVDYGAATDRIVLEELREKRLKEALAEQERRSRLTGK